MVQYTNPIPKKERLTIEDIRELVALKKALVKENIITQAKIDAEK